MQQFYKIFLLLLFTAAATHAQQAERKLLKGKVVANSNELAGIYVANLNTDFGSLTEPGGYFSIPAKTGDTLMFSSVQLKALKVVLKKSDMEGELLFVKMEILQRQLDEVKISEYKNINAVSLGILSKPAKKYTPAERRLYTATGGGNQFGTSTKVSLDGILNAINGTTAMRKKEIVIERKEVMLKKITDLFEESYFTETLQIPGDYVKAFQYYLVEDQEFASAMNDKNKTMAAFIMNRLAAEYLALLEKK